MAFNDFNTEQTCPRCTRQALIPDEGLRSLVDNETPICPVCHEEERFYRDPWPGYPAPVNDDELEPVTVDDLRVRHWRYAGAHGVLNAPREDGLRESRIALRRGPLRYTSGVYRHGETVAPEAVTDLLFHALKDSIDEEERTMSQLPSTFDWKDPEPGHIADTVTRAWNLEVRNVLRNHPKRWASILHLRSQGSVASYRREYGPEGFEFQTRERPSMGRYELFARYNPDPEAIENYDPTQDPGADHDVE